MRRDHPQVKTLKRADAFLAHLADIDVGAALRRPARPRRAAGADRGGRPHVREPVRDPARWRAGTARDDGRPTDLVRRRWQRFGESGAGLVWGGEAYAVRPEGRANPHQLCLGPTSADDLAELHALLDPEPGHRAAADPQRPLVGRPAPGAVGPAAGRPPYGSRPHRRRARRHRRRLRHGGRPGPRRRLRLRGREGVPRLPPPRAALRCRRPRRQQPHDAHHHRAGAGRGHPRRRAAQHVRPPAAPPRSGRRRRGGGRRAVGLRRSRSPSSTCWASTCCASPRAARTTARTRSARPGSRRATATPRPRTRWWAWPGCSTAPPPIAAARPAVTVVATGFSYLQEWLPHVASAVVRDGGAALVGIGRMALSYPDLPADVLAGRPLDRSPPVPHVQRLHHRAAQRPGVRLLPPRSLLQGARRPAAARRRQAEGPCLRLRNVAVVGLGIGQMHVWSWRRMKDRFTIVAVADPDEARRRRRRPAHRRRHLSPSRSCSRATTSTSSTSAPRRRCTSSRSSRRWAPASTWCARSRSSPRCATATGWPRRRRPAPGVLMPIFQYRFGNGLQKVKALVDRGVAGQAYTSSVEVAWRRRAEYYAVPWRGRWETELGGVLLSQAVHALDMLTFIAGPPTKVFARVTTRVNDIEVEDCAAISLELADGSLATITATLGSDQEITRHRFHFANLSAESGTSAYESSADPWDIHPDDDDRGRGHRRGARRVGGAARGLVGPVRALRRRPRRRRAAAGHAGRRPGVDRADHRAVRLGPPRRRRRAAAVPRPPPLRELAACLRRRSSFDAEPRRRPSATLEAT